MTFTTRVLLAAVAVAALAIFGTRVWTAPREQVVSASQSSVTAMPVTPSVAASEPSGSIVSGRTDLVSYAVAVNELHGLSPQAIPGTTLDIWVAWEPPVTKKPRIQPLLADVILEGIAPPVLPDGPHAALLLVPAGQISDLLYGDRYGSLSVTIPHTSAAR